MAPSSSVHGCHRASPTASWRVTALSTAAIGAPSHASSRRCSSAGNSAPQPACTRSRTPPSNNVRSTRSEPAAASVDPAVVAPTEPVQRSEDLRATDVLEQGRRLEVHEFGPLGRIAMRAARLPVAALELVARSARARIVAFGADHEGHEQLEHFVVEVGALRERKKVRGPCEVAADEQVGRRQLVEVDVVDDPAASAARRCWFARTPSPNESAHSAASRYTPPPDRSGRPVIMRSASRAGSSSTRCARSGRAR